MLNEARVPFVAVLADPCTGGVVASFATLADICIAEPGAQLYFTGPRVIAETTKEKLPPDFGRGRAQPRAAGTSTPSCRAPSCATGSPTTSDCWKEVVPLRTNPDPPEDREAVAREGWLKQRLGELARLLVICPASICRRRSRGCRARLKTSEA